MKAARPQVAFRSFPASGVILQVACRPVTFARLEELSSKLNKTSDDLNQTIKRVEEKLASLRLGVSAYVHHPLRTEEVRSPDSQTSIMYTTLLGYGKVNGSWCLHVSESPDFDPEQCHHTPLQQASRDLRVAALHKLPDLIRELVKNAEAELLEVEEARRAADSVELP